jgi:hypothetical protein
MANQQTAEHHKKAAEHHKEVAKHHEAGNDEKAGHHAHVAHKHHLNAVNHAAGLPGQTRSWALTDAQQMIGALADALVLARQVSSAKARQVLDWQP